jgi:hypothetical protein
MFEFKAEEHLFPVIDYLPIKQVCSDTYALPHSQKSYGNIS